MAEGFARAYGSDVMIPASAGLSPAPRCAPAIATHTPEGILMRKYAMLALLAILPPVLSAARITLRDGSVVYGQFISGTSQTIVFQDDNGVRRRFDVNQVQNIDFGGV